MSALETLLGPLPSCPAGLPDHLSPAAISEFYACPEKWRRKRLHGEREPAGPPLLVGSAVHKSAEHIYRTKLETGEPPSIEDAAEAAAAGWDIAVDEATEDAGIEWANTKPDTAKDQAVSLARCYREHRLVTETVPLAVEETGSAEFPSSPVPITFRVDVRTANGIMDVKTVSASASLTAARPDDRLKGLVYVRSLGLGFDWHYIKKITRPTIYKPAPLPASSVVLAIADRRIGFATSEIARLYAQYGPDETWPTNAPEHPWRCGYCGLRADCPVAL